MDALPHQSSLIKAEALRLGFDACGISRVTCHEEALSRLRNFLEKGYHGSMAFLERNIEKRADPSKLVEGALSVITVTLNYFPGLKPEDPQIPVVSKYAYGEDYHDIVRNRLKKLLRYINTNIGTAHGRAFADSAPVFDKLWAAEAGLGWIGKNSCLISPRGGSYFFIGTLLIDVPLAYDKSIQNYCGTCKKCLEACPTGAIVSPYIVDARRCISYLTIENKGEIPAEFAGKMNNRIFGCDICQDACPWNRKAVHHQVKEFEPLPGLTDMKYKEWLEMDEKQFDQRFSKSPLKRTGYEGLRRNLKFIS